jgi:putative Mg2+ transporter-C (MgtC) family protein
LLAGLLGLDRQIHGCWAGLRTHILVSLGCCILVLGGTVLGSEEGANLSRIIQGIAAGVGFIGAGTILKLPRQERVEGLTTASSIWLAAGLGTACGLRLYLLAATNTLLTLVVLVALGWAERRFGSNTSPPAPREASGGVDPRRDKPGGSPSPAPVWRPTSGVGGCP